MSPRLDADLLIAGGGPTGLFAATAAARAGLRVTVLEPREAPVDKACGEGVMPGGVAALRRVCAAADLALPGRPFAGIRYLDGRSVAEARFGQGNGHGIRRTELQATLLAAATSAGAEVVRRRVGGVRQHRPHDADGTVEAGGLRARYLLAADGLRSPVRTALRLDLPASGAQRYGVRRHFAVEPWTDLVEVHWTGGAEAYVTPVADDLVGVAVLSGRVVDFDGAIRAAPQLARSLRDARAVGPALGAGPLRQRVRSRVAGRVLLVGDAGGYVDALTGEGLSLGFAQAELAVGAVLGDRPGSYAAAARAAVARHEQLTRALLALQGRAFSRRAIVPTAARAPWLMQWCVDRLASPAA